ncbi:MAG: formylglycine-generating enzyme family protein [Verrucomicrobiales bacterium]
MLPPTLTLALPDGSPDGVPLTLAKIPSLDVEQAAQRDGVPLSFLMGARGESADEEPRHRVVIPQPFYLGMFPVTQRQFAAWTGSKDYKQWLKTNQNKFSAGDSKPHQNSFARRPDHPAENLNWYEAKAFCEWVNRRVPTPLPDGYSCCLPSEAQWEYACRAGTLTDYWSGDGEAALREVGWYDKNSDEGTCAVGSLGKPNPWGLHDMHGNVWEWCEDVYDAHAYAKRPYLWPGSAWTLAEAGQEAQYYDDEDRAGGHPRRVMRGGSWFDSAGLCRSAFRAGGGPQYRVGNLGFRLCLSSGSGGRPASQRPGRPG